MQITIRQAKFEDAALLTALHADVHKHHSDAQPQHFKATDGKDPAVIQYFTDNLEDASARILIAEVDGEAVGYILLLHRVFEENVFAYAHSRLHIDQMSVSAQYRSNGIGHLLMEKTLEYARELDVNYVTLGVWAFNEAAIAFYEREGFEVMTQTMWVKLK